MPAPYTDAVEKLKADHDRVEALFRQLKEADDSATTTIGVHVCNLVKIHMTLEEELFYPALRGSPQARESKLDEGLVEHDAGKLLINDVLSDPGQDKASAKLQVLGEQMVHHHKEEEEDGGIFEQARNAGIDLMEMLHAMNARESELRSELREGDLPAAEMNFVNVDATPE
ncbi:MAG: hemerythrin domain-containing protein [Pseudomonadota bacterium]